MKMIILSLLISALLIASCSGRQGSKSYSGSDSKKDVFSSEMIFEYDHRDRLKSVNSEIVYTYDKNSNILGITKK